ncbi:hypothetical protein DICPUDRAFT_100122 [Dictyostelium purpureum]|uniref:Ubiquitin-like domain-containing protein n=1 Tax=Dictyostelium purpureum TaxID=5786 RepID=F1A5P7_DICPU|nr:uncharacterized protein DICPUDRAFT_100122 [Dictyostelium purpureum]EGC28482.1 hypothetical protein DICPUDRAFT_100122 [Dictyostelium purpureum]|eukprot:XP_003294991.1 hypothetical protein DICPUDRAFT_100122 [Dictyostelium purpureum]
MTTDYDQEFQQYEHKVFGKPISVLTSSQLKSAIAQRGGVIKTSFYYKDDLINRLKELLKEEMMNNNANTAAGILSSSMGGTGSQINSLNSSGVGIGSGSGGSLNNSGVGLNMNGSNANIMTPSTHSPNNLTISEKKRAMNTLDFDDSSSNDYNESSSPITTTPSKKINSGFNYYSSNKATITTASSGISSSSNTPTISMQNLYEDNHKQKALELEHRILGNFSFYFILKRLNFSPALKLTEEFVKFIVLKVMDNDNGVDVLTTKLLAPPLVNKVWCEVILNTIKYKELLNLIRSEVHHNPIFGMNDSLDVKRKRYERCIELYTFYFNCNPTETNPEIWPPNLYLDNDVSGYSLEGDDDTIQVINDSPQNLTPQQIHKLQQQNEYYQNKISRLEKELYKNNSNNSKINNISKNNINDSSFDSIDEHHDHEDIEVVSANNKKKSHKHQQQQQEQEHQEEHQEQEQQEQQEQPQGDSSDGESNLEMDLENHNENNTNKKANGINGHHRSNGSGEYTDNDEKNDSGNNEDNEDINVQISTNKGQFVYNIKKSQPFKKIMDSSSKKIGCDSNSIRFLFRNKALSPESTPASIGLENNEIIDLIVTDN